MESHQQFCLRWNNHQSTLISVFDHLLESGTLVDCTLAAEGQFLKAHKVVLSACSPYLEALLSQHYEKHPILILKDVTFHELKSMLDYMYRGEVNITQEQLGTFLKAAESLQIKGLTDSGAICDGRDFKRERMRELNRVDRSVGVSKRTEVKRPFSRLRSPVFGLSQNLMNVDGVQKAAKHSVSQDNNSLAPTVIRNGEGSSSPSNKKKRLYPPANEGDPGVFRKPQENNYHEENNKLDKCKELPMVLETENPVPSITASSGPMRVTKYNSTNAESEDMIGSDVIKREVKTENSSYVEEVLNEDSVEDITAIDEEEDDEAMDEADLSKPGPSNASNSNVVGIPWHMAGEGNGDDLLLGSQQDLQDAALMTTAVKSVIECVKCHKTYSSAHTLRRHVRLECGQEPKFLCPYCPHRTKQRYNLMLHIGRTHREMLSNAGVSVDNWN